MTGYSQVRPGAWHRDPRDDLLHPGHQAAGQQAPEAPGREVRYYHVTRYTCDTCNVLNIKYLVNCHIST